MPFFPRFHYPPTSTGTSGQIYPADMLALLNEAASAISSPSSNSSSATSRRGFSPNFDVHETEHAYVLEGELPGLSDKKSVSLEFTDDNTLHVSGKIERSHPHKKHAATITEAGEGGEGEKKQQQQQGQQGQPKYWVSERNIGEFSRSFSFPGSIDIEAVKATLDYGVLKIVVPKKEKPTGRKIQIA